MARRNSKAGGFFIFLGVIAGVIWGMASGALMDGILFGTLAGVVAAAALWLFDRRRA